MLLFTDKIKKRVISKLGAPTIDIELNDEQIKDLFDIAQSHWFLYSPISNLNKEKVQAIQSVWIESYFQALCKETLGRVRGKYSEGFSIPGVDKVILDFKTLLDESTQEKENLIGLLIPNSNKIVLAIYINIDNMEAEQVEKYLKKCNAFLEKDKSYKFFLFPVREQASRIECVYPNFIYDEEMKVKLNTCLDNIINNIKHE